MKTNSITLSVLTYNKLYSSIKSKLKTKSFESYKQNKQEISTKNTQYINRTTQWTFPNRIYLNKSNLYRQKSAPLDAWNAQGMLTPLLSLNAGTYFAGNVCTSGQLSRRNAHTAGQRSSMRTTILSTPTITRNRKKPTQYSRHITNSNLIHKISSAPTTSNNNHLPLPRI